MSCTLFLYFPLAVTLQAMIVWLWGVILDRHEHDPGRVKGFMLLGLIAATSLEMSLSSRGITQPAVLAVALVANFWGGCDAVLRFPAAHRLESFFGKKQVLLMAAKTCAYFLGLVRFGSSFNLFLSLLLTNIWGLPFLYLMALPMDPKEQVLDSDADIDVMVKVWRLAVRSEERRQCLASCAMWWRRTLMTFSEQQSPLALLVLSATSAGQRRRLRKRGRCV